MPQRSRLNGIPHNLVMSFFGTEYYYNGGYMADWLANAAKLLTLQTASLDLLTGLYSPEQLNIRPLAIRAARLKDIITRELRVNGFALDFIVEVKIDFEFPDPNKRIIHCHPCLIDQEGRRYQSACFVGQAFEPEFDPFDEHRIYPFGKLD